MLINALNKDVICITGSVFNMMEIKEVNRQLKRESGLAFSLCFFFFFFKSVVHKSVGDVKKATSISPYSRWMVPLMSLCLLHI